MAKKIMQFRYYGDNNSIQNQPSGISTSSLLDGSVFNNYYPIVQLGIQTLPGVKFYVNGDKTTNPVMIGSTGIYELDLDGLTEITQLQFASDSLANISENNSAYLIIDIVYTSDSQEVN